MIRSHSIAFLTVPTLVFLLGCGLEEKAAEDSAVTCCTCLVNEACVRASEYEFCKDTLARGGSLQLSGLRDFTCNEEACVEANQCGSRSPGGGEGSDSAADSKPGSVPDDTGSNVDDGDLGGTGQYVLTVESAEFDQSDLGGLAWDFFEADRPPDPFVSVRIDGMEIGTTETLSNTYSPTWTDTFVFDAGPTTELSFRFFDYDDDTDDDYGGEYVVGDLASAISNGGETVSLSRIAVSRLTYSIRER